MDYKDQMTRFTAMAQAPYDVVKLYGIYTQAKDWPGNYSALRTIEDYVDEKLKNHFSYRSFMECHSDPEARESGGGALHHPAR